MLVSLNKILQDVIEVKFSEYDAVKIIKENALKTNTKIRIQGFVPQQMKPKLNFYERLLANIDLKG